MNHIEADFNGNIKISRELKKFLKESIKLQRRIYDAIQYKSSYKESMGLYFSNGYLISITPYAMGYVKIDYRDFVEPNAEENDTDFYFYWSVDDFDKILESIKAGDEELFFYLQDNYELKSDVNRTIKRAFEFIEQKWNYLQNIYIPRTKVKKLWYFGVENNNLVFRGKNEETEQFWVSIDTNFRSSTLVYNYLIGLFGSKELLDLSLNSEETMSLFFSNNLEIGVIGSISQIR